MIQTDLSGENLGNNSKVQNQSKKLEQDENQQENNQKNKIVTISTILREFDDLKKNFDK